MKVVYLMEIDRETPMNMIFDQQTNTNYNGCI